MTNGMEPHNRQCPRHSPFLPGQGSGTPALCHSRQNAAFCHLFWKEALHASSGPPSVATCTQSSKFPRHKHLSKTSDPSVTRGPDLLSPWIRCSGLRMGRSAQAELKPGGRGGVVLVPWGSCPSTDLRAAQVKQSPARGKLPITRDFPEFLSCV